MSLLPPTARIYEYEAKGYLELISVVAGLTPEVTRGFGTVHDFLSSSVRKGGSNISSFRIRLPRARDGGRNGGGLGLLPGHDHRSG